LLGVTSPLPPAGKPRIGGRGGPTGRTLQIGRRELRKLRLRALADAQYAFFSTLEEVEAFPEEVWRRWAEGGPALADFIAREGGASIGMAAIFAESGVPGRMQLVAMWVDPHCRRRGVAGALIDQAVSWARHRQACEVILWVADQNSAAGRLYERIGCQPTGGRQPLPSRADRVDAAPAPRRIRGRSKSAP
jgi:GNAT superfamily N-acetyltransferase